MPQVQITDLPQALPLAGTESVPIVQNGVTVQTTTGAIAGAGALNYPFLTVGSTAGLTEARYLSVGTGLSLADNGAGSTLQVNLTGASLSLDSSGTGLIVKTGPNTVTPRAIAVNGGLTIANADGVAGNPTIGLNANLQNLAGLSGIGLVTINGSAFSQTTILGVANQVTVTNGNANGGNPTIGLASNPILPGAASVVLPQGTTAQRGSALYGALRYNTEIGALEAFTAAGWGAITSGTGVVTFSAGSTGLTPNTPTAGGVTLGGILNPASGGTGVNNGTYTTTLGGNVLTAGPFTTSGAFSLTLTATGATNVTLPTTGTLATLAGSEILINKTISGSNNTLTNIGNSSLTNSSVTYNGVTVSLGGSGTITAYTTNSLTFNDSGSGGSSPTTFDGSAAKTISYNTIGASPLAGSTSLTTLGTITTGVWNGTTIAVLNGGTGATTASGARTNLGAAASGINSDITSLTGITNGISTPDYIDFHIASGATTAPGRIFWDGGTTLNVGMTANVTGKALEDSYYYIKASSAITKGQVIMFTGAVGASGVPTGAPATGVTDGSYIMGIAAENIANNAFGLVQYLGTLRGVNTSAYADGDILWYDPSVVGGLTKTKPNSPNVKVQMCAVVSAGNNGAILIRVSAGSVLGGTDSNVQFGTLNNLDVIQYDSGLGYWKNVAATSLSVGSATNATNATNTGITANSTNATNYLTFVSATTGNLPQLVNSSITCNPSTGQITGGIAGGSF